MGRLTAFYFNRLSQYSQFALHIVLILILAWAVRRLAKTNMSRGFAHAVIDVGVAYREDIDEVMNIMRLVGSELRNADGFDSKILEDMEMAGVDKWDDSAVVIRCRFKVLPLEQ